MHADGGGNWAAAKPKLGISAWRMPSAAVRPQGGKAERSGQESMDLPMSFQSSARMEQRMAKEQPVGSPLPKSWPVWIPYTLIGFGLLWILNPIDLPPDAIPVAGTIDDAVVGAGSIGTGMASLGRRRLAAVAAIAVAEGIAKGLAATMARRGPHEGPAGRSERAWTGGE